MIDTAESQPGLFAAVLGLLGLVVGSIEQIEAYIRVIVMVATGLAAIAGFLYNIEKWRKERSERISKEKK